MKKVLLLACPLLLGACSSSNIAVKPLKKALNGNEAYANLVSYFASTYQIDSVATNHYTGKSYHVIDEVSPVAKANLVYDEEDNLISEQFIVSENGFAKEQYLDLSNKILTRNVNGAALSFKDHYASPLSKIFASEDTIEKYFTLTQSEDHLIFTANEMGKEVSASLFGSFFTFFDDSFPWHGLTTVENISSLTLVSDKSGNPLEMEFVKTKRDRNGGISETYFSSFASIASVSSLLPYQYQGSVESYNTLSSALTSLNEKLLGFNFTQTIINPTLDDIVPNGLFHNYYDFYGGYGAMICDLEFHESTYGRTYLGLAYNASKAGYVMTGISPDANYSAVAGDDAIANLVDAIPLIRYLALDFFVYDEVNQAYVFDLDKFLGLDFTFSTSILIALLGPEDPIAFKFGYYFEYPQSYIYNFHSLSITLDSEANPTFHLTYTDLYGYVVTMQTYFSDFGTVDLANDPKLGYAYELVA